jgi:hypothetical protein
LIVLLGAAGFVAWTDFVRANRVSLVTDTDHETAVVDASSPTGYAGGKRWLIVPEHNNRSYQWIAETQQMLARGEWQVQHVDYDDAPTGRTILSATPCRWWLGLIARVDHLITGRPIGLAVEQAALLAEPLLHLGFLVATTALVALLFGSFSAALVALGLALLYPLAGGFLPGMPDDYGLAWACGLWSVLPLLALVGSPTKNATDAASAADPGRSTRRRFLIAGIAGGLGLWINPAIEAPVLAGTGLGGMLAAWLAMDAKRQSPTSTPALLPWRTWALSGAVTCLAAYLIEHFPGRPDLRLEFNHPLYGLAWLGLGELLVVTESWFRQVKGGSRFGLIGRLLLALAAMAALPVTFWKNGAASLLALDQLNSRLIGLPGGVVAASLPAWLARDGLTGPVAATGLPLLLLLPVVWLMVRRQTEAATRRTLAIGLGPLAVVLGLAFFHLRYWNLADALLLALVAAATTGATRRGRGLWSGLAALTFAPGLLLLVPAAVTKDNIRFTPLEARSLVERALAHWIADHSDAPGAVVLLPPDRTMSFSFHGGLRGLGSADWANRDGLEATLRIATATTANDALALLNQHGVNFIVLPSWDADLDAFARWTLRNPEDGFIMALHHWALPPWLRPLPYPLPENAGFDDQSVVVLKVTDDTNRAAGLSRLAEYFIETRQIEHYASIADALQRYPTDLGALAALDQVQKALGNLPACNQTLATILTSVTSGADRALPWDRRISLAVALALGDRTDLARPQVQRCLAELTDARIRALTTGLLYRLLLLAKAYGLPFAEPAQRARALALLPVELRSRL